MDIDSTKPEEMIETPGLDHVLKQLVPQAADALKRGKKYQPVLVVGPTGSGKSFIRDKILEKAGYSDGNYTSVNCAEFAENLIESELFGHTKGAFTGAVAKKAGVFKPDAQGLVVLDEIDSFPKHVQAKLLRLLETGDFKVVGAEEPSHTNQRILAISNAKLSEDVFRADFLQRFLKVSIPPLHKRRTDIIVLLRALAPDVPWTRNDLFRLLCYPWPGNVRELARFARLAQYHRESLLKNSSAGKGVLHWFYFGRWEELGIEPPVEREDMPDVLDLLVLMMKLKEPRWRAVWERVRNFCPLMAPKLEALYSERVDLSQMDTRIGARQFDRRYDKVENRQNFLYCWRVDLEDFCALFGQDYDADTDFLANINHGYGRWAHWYPNAAIYMSDEQRNDFIGLAADIKKLIEVEAQQEDSFADPLPPSTGSMRPLSPKEEFKSALKTLVTKVNPDDYQRLWAAYWRAEHKRGLSKAHISKQTRVDVRKLNRWFEKSEGHRHTP